MNALRPVAVGKRRFVTVGGTGVTVSVAVGIGVEVSVGLVVNVTVNVGVGVSVIGHCTVMVGKLQAMIAPTRNMLIRAVR